MPDYILFSRSDATAEVLADQWQSYLDGLSGKGRLRGGSAIGGGMCFRRGGEPAPLTSGIVGFVRVEAGDLADAERLLAGNPVYEAGGTIEIRELPRSA